MGSLVTLINRSAVRAIITGTEAITEKLLEATAIDIAAQEKRKETAARRRNRAATKARQTRQNHAKTRVPLEQATSMNNASVRKTSTRTRQAAYRREVLGTNPKRRPQPRRNLDAPTSPDIPGAGDAE
jgi:KaiC/GvpD/RAD55 family RecA-like ATPase